MLGHTRSRMINIILERKKYTTAISSDDQINQHNDSIEFYSYEVVHKISQKYTSEKLNIMNRDIIW